MTIPVLPLDDCIQQLVSFLPLSRTNNIPLKRQASLYVACLGFLVHLQKDQVRLRQRTAGAQEECRFPPPSEIPAMMTVVQDARLFQALLACLRVETVHHHHHHHHHHGGPHLGEDPLHHSYHHHHHHHHPARSSTTSMSSNRKRSYSFQEREGGNHHPAEKYAKVQHSPMIGSTKQAIHSSASSNPPLSRTTPTPATTSTFPEISLPVRVVAATILYAALQPLDHWPAQLLQAYAEDFFGPRAWVDDERCSLLVQNLALAHDSSLTENASPDQLLQDKEDAKRVANFFASHMDASALEDGNHVTKDTTMTAMSPVAPEAPITTMTRTGLSSSPWTENRPRANSASSSTDLTPQPSRSLVDDGESSDSGDECLVEVSAGMLARAGNGESDGSSSSSSGEEDEEVVVTAESFGEGNNNTFPSTGVTPPMHTPLTPSRPSYPCLPATVNLNRVRPRYVGVNLEHAHQAIASALAERLDGKFKQNSRLLLSLPSFLSIPEVRRLVARSLERWLQSPALSAQARSLFGATVQNLKHVDPPLPADLEAIDSILGMHLKVNQLSVHIENMTAVVKRIPTVTIARHVLLQLLREELSVMENATSQSASSTEPLQMIAAVHCALSSTLRSDGLAMAFLALLGDPDTRRQVSLRERHRFVRKLRLLLRSVASTLGASFDAYGLLESLLSVNVGVESRSLQDEEDKARLLFECVSLLIPTPAPLRDKSIRSKSQRPSSAENKDETESTRKHLTRARKLLLKWCCSDYAPLWQAGEDQHTRIANRIRKRESKESHIAGAGKPTFSSVLDGQENTDARYAQCPETLRCVLFMEKSESFVMRSFLYPDVSPDDMDPVGDDEKYRIDRCFSHGADLDDGILEIVLEAAASGDESIGPALALSLIEHLFACCTSRWTAKLRLTDPQLIWRMYSLTEYIPPKKDMAISNGDYVSGLQNGAENGTKNDSSSVPRLAYPGMWWRVTTLALVMCGNSPHVSAVMYDANPTVAALIKMATAGRYRFPTVDCDEELRNKMKKAEADMREEELQITEQLFLPPSPSKATSTKKGDDSRPKASFGQRVSARQLERQEKLRKLQHEKEAAEALELAARRKHMLRAAQKSIMIWDPKGSARKPPKESVNLILSVEEQFCLSDVFRRCIKPDFLLKTVGQTTRSAIERASDWLLPIISSFPESIDRLPSSASCFLLLRAYGAEGGKSELRKLSAPLLEHVSKSVAGVFGKSGAIRAADLLLADMADRHPDRRRCARRVLRESLSGSKASLPGATPEDDLTGLLTLLRVEHAPFIVSDAIRYMTQALSFERGDVLSALVVALDKYILYARDQSLGDSWDLSFILCDLISRRHVVCSEAMDRSPDFQLLATRVVHGELQRSISSSKEDASSDDGQFVRIKPCVTDKADPEEWTLSRTLLDSICVLLSTFRDGDGDDNYGESSKAIDDMTGGLMLQSEFSEVKQDSKNGCERGLASAVNIESGKRAVTVEQWVMLAKARNDSIARRSALSAPVTFLPRLLLCSGLPVSSLLTMIDRLGKLGEKTDNQEEEFRKLFAPNAVSEWSYTASRRDIPRKLVGRLSAYIRLTGSSLLLNEKKVSSTFLDWLSEEAGGLTTSDRSPRAKKASKPEAVASGFLLNITSASSILDSIATIESEIGVCSSFPKKEAPSEELLPVASSSSLSIPVVYSQSDARRYLQECFQQRTPDSLQHWLHGVFPRLSPFPLPSTLSKQKVVSSIEFDATDLAAVMLNCLPESKPDSSLESVVLTWTPVLSQASGSEALWEALFSSRTESSLGDLLLSKCLLTWHSDHVKKCQDWVLQVDSPYSTNFSIPRMVRFLLLSSGQHSLHLRQFGDSVPSTHEFWGRSKDSIQAGVSLAMECAKLWVGRGAIVSGRNDVPDWLSLLLLVARRGKNAMSHVCEVLLGALSREQAMQTELGIIWHSAILRIYCYFPQRMSLGKPALRSVLMEAVVSVNWQNWRSPLDPQLDTLIAAMTTGTSPRLVQSLAELSKNHPLLLLRKLPLLADLLHDDASRTLSRTRGRVNGENILGKMVAAYPDDGRQVRVAVHHWGYTFSEPLWMSIIDVLLAVPREVLFRCGMYIGLKSVLLMYTKLLFVQSQLKNNGSPRVKEKFSALLSGLETANKVEWEKWLASEVDDLPPLGTVRNVLVSCSLMDSNKGIDSIRTSKQEHS